MTSPSPSGPRGGGPSGLPRRVLDQAVQGVLFFAALGPMLVEGGGVPVSEGVLEWIRAGNILFAGLLAWAEFRRLRRAGYSLAHVREEIVDWALLGATAILALEEWITGGALLGLDGLDAFVGPSKAYILANLVLRIVRLFRHIVRARIAYEKIFIGSFLAVIAAGTLLLWAFPGAANRTVDPGKTIGFSDALFTSVSATCVTGLVVVDTGSEFSRFGQTIVLVLMQIGGLGLMTFAAFFGLALGKGIGFTDRLILRDMMNVDPLSTLGRLLAGIVGVTFVVEGLGALFLFGSFPDPALPGAMLGSEDQAFYAVFHSVSAFCNAGFTLYPDGWMRFASSPLLNLVVVAQIVLGGLGFTVILNLLGITRRLGDRLRSRFRRGPITEEEEEEEERREPARISLQTRLVLRISGVLIVGGALLFWVFERDNALADADGSTTLLASLFQSVTTRTAGFNTVDVGTLRPVTLFLMAFLMFIGASPGGTGGGIKTVTAMVLARSVATLARGRSRVEFLRRSLPPVVTSQAMVVVTLGVLSVFVGTLLLSLTEIAPGRTLGPGGVARGDPFLALLFEAVSAFGTVGLSTGITPSLSGAGRVVIIVLMFVGRVGPLALTLAAGRKRPVSYEFPEERVMIG